ncbi:MAG: hypothetical protein ACI92Z_003324 [Paracoccaceae bacterium]|jgi:uncharacterized protein (TIGR02186 family)
MRWLALLLIALPFMAHAEEVVLGLSKDKVAITTSFDGSEILIFGAVKREVPIPMGAPLEVVITVASPYESVIVRRKAYRYGIWVNVDSVEVDSAPVFYAVATSGPLDDVLTATEDLRENITINQSIRSVGAPSYIKDAGSFTDAIIRIRREADLYQLLEGQVAVDQQTLFRTSIKMPANLTEGDYTTRIFLTRAGQIVASYETSIDVRKVGLERWLYVLSRENPMWYGLMSLAIAIAAGWGASAAFRLLRNT